MYDKIVARPSAASVSAPQAAANGRSLRRIGKAILAWYQFRQSRREALSLDDRMLEDVGLTRMDLRRSGYFDTWGR